jgi:anti-sigma factor RsiW
MKPLDFFTCEETFRRVEDYVDRELSPDELRLVEEHLQVCARCAHEFDFESAVLNDVRKRLTRIQVSPSIRQRVARALEDERRAVP